jgi:aminoglycoside phosphotransferase (APT) family kinase protein
MEAHIPLVRRLVAAQFPQWANLAVVPVESVGRDNTIFRLGRELAVRLPRRRVSAEHVRKEHRWLPVMAPYLPAGSPGSGRPGSARGRVGFPSYRGHIALRRKGDGRDTQEVRR